MQMVESQNDSFRKEFQKWEMRGLNFFYLLNSGDNNKSVISVRIRYI